MSYKEFTVDYFERPKLKPTLGVFNSELAAIYDCI